MMPRMRIAAFFLAAAALVFPGAAQAETETFAPAGPWAIDYAEQSCRLMRNFSNGERSVTLKLERAELGPRLLLEIAGADLDYATRARTTRYRYGPAGAEREGPLARLANAVQVGNAPLLDGFEAANSWTEWSYEAELAAAAGIEAVTVSGTFGDEITLRLGAMREPVAALQACVDDLMNDWGIDAREQVSATRHAEPTSDPQDWLGKGDYPREMLRIGMGGFVRLRLLVDESGRATKCIATASNQVLSNSTCLAVMERASFTPALDEAGDPMTGLYIANVVYRAVPGP